MYYNQGSLKHLVESSNQEIQEKWKNDVKVEKTGEHKGKKSAEQLKQEVEALKKKHENAKKKNSDYEVSDADKDQMGELLFAIRAKGGWKKGEGAADTE